MSERATLTLRGKRAPTPRAWICKPCGARFDQPADLAEDDDVRCPACTARLGKMRDLANPSPNFERLRCRPAPVKAAVAPANLVTRRQVKTVWTRR